MIEIIVIVIIVIQIAIVSFLYLARLRLDKAKHTSRMDILKVHKNHVCIRNRSENILLNIHNRYNTVNSNLFRSDLCKLVIGEYKFILQTLAVDYIIDDPLRVYISILVKDKATDGENDVKYRYDKHNYSIKEFIDIFIDLIKSNVQEKISNYNLLLNSSNKDSVTNNDVLNYMLNSTSIPKKDKNISNDAILDYITDYITD
jgi:hypothetical protein